MGEQAGKWKSELALPPPHSPSSHLPLPRFLSGMEGRCCRPLWVSAPAPCSPLQDLSTQLSRTGTLSRKSIKAPATPASATLG